MPNIGPYRIVEIKKDTYSLEDLITGKIRNLHISRLIPFNYDPEKVDPNEIAARNNQMFIIEEIIKHKGNPKNKTKMEFLVKWKGYDESENTWEPWDNLKKNEKLIEYLNKKNLNKLVIKSLST